MRPMRLIMIASLFLTACSAPVVKGSLFEGAKPPGAEPRSLELRPGEAIVVLSAESVSKDESWPAACVRDAIQSEDSKIPFMAPQTFRDATFPWFETHEVGGGIAELKKMPSLAKAIEQIGVRYLISAGGQTTGTPEENGLGGAGPSGGALIGKHGFMLCAGGAGCLGFLAWQRTSDVSATVWDLKRGILAAGIAAKVSGASLMPALMLPVPLIPPTETAACKALGRHLARFVATGEMPETAEVGDDEQDVSFGGQGALNKKPATDR